MGMFPANIISNGDWITVETGCKYKVVDGIAYVQIKDDNAIAGSWTFKGSTYPKPSNMSSSSDYFFASAVNGNYGIATVRIDGGGGIAVRPTGNSGCYTFFSYPTI